LIEFNNVSMTYQTGTAALKDVTFTIQDGEFVFIIGRSGAGKSTLIKLLTCEEKPSSGQVLIDDFDISRIRRSLVPYLRRNIGMIFQDFRLIYTKTVFENVAFAMEIVGCSRKSIARRVPIVLSIVGLRDKAKARPNELSGGEQQRVAIARAMVNNPMLILADEPTGNLDPANSEAVMALLEEINRSGTTVVICTHHRELVDCMKKRVVEIDDGYLVRDDVEGVYSHHKSTVRSSQPDQISAERIAELKAKPCSFEPPHAGLTADQEAES
jgi:cell division transport system ATP-binding protein